MSRIGFPAAVVGLTILAALVAAAAAPGRPGMVTGVALGMGVAGGFAALAVAVFQRIKTGNRGPEGAAEGPEQATNRVGRMARAFAGLMMARMLAYLALVMAAVGLKFADPVGVGAGLVAGTLVFQTMEVLYLRKMT